LGQIASLTPYKNYIIIVTIALFRFRNM